MALAVNTNLLALNGQRNLNQSAMGVSSALQRLSSGLRINSAKDDAAGLAISSRMTSQVRGLDQAIRNANDGISVAQVAEGALQEVTNSLQRMRELAVQSANDTNSSSDRASLQAEVTQLQSEMTRISSTTEFNGTKVLDGTFTNAKFQVGFRANQTINISIGNTAANTIGNNSVTGDSANVSGINSAVAAAANVNGGSGSTVTTANRITAQTLTISGNLGQDTVAVTLGESAADIATGINDKTSTTGVTATASTVATLSTISTGATTFKIAGDDGTLVSISASTTGSGTGLDPLVQAINDVSSTTGIVAERSGDSITLTNSNGADIAIQDVLIAGIGTLKFTGDNSDATSQTLGGTTSTDSSVVGGTVTLASQKSFSMSSSVAAASGSLVAAAASTAVGSSLSKVSDVNIGTQSGANSALDVIDAALSFVNSVRGDLGAIQNRFTSTISNLQNVTENVSAARSRIQDADFAAETSNLTKNQILQQAGISVLAQANQLPSSVLSLLQ
ncbi:MAG: flagellin [Deltaproteobacteria bacterium]|nr:flagellin [Deltaproteobacteria bacterium]